METAPPAGPRQHETDEQILHKLGYAQELFRGMGGFQNFAISFTIISILAGCLTSYFVGFERGGPVAVIWGWLLVGLFSTIIALAMAEIASAYPDRGRPLLLGLEAREPRLGLDHRLVQPDRPDRGHCGHRVRPGDIRHGAVRLLVQLLGAHERLVRLLGEHVDLRAVRDLPDRSRDHQHVPGQRHGTAEHDLRVLAHGGRRVHRAGADHRPGQPPEPRLRLRRDRQRLRVTGMRPTTSRVRRSGSCSASGCCSRSTRSPASTRPRTWPRRRVRRHVRRLSACTWRWSSRSSSAGSFSWR